MNRKTFLSLVDGFWSRVDKSGDCWLWTGELNNQGYGRYALYDGDRRERVLAHRMSLILTGVTLAKDDVLLHSCDTPRCVRPEHLSVGTQTTNMQDAKSKGRMNLTGLSAPTPVACRTCGDVFMGQPRERYCANHKKTRAQYSREWRERQRGGAAS